LSYRNPFNLIKNGPKKVKSGDPTPPILRALRIKNNIMNLSKKYLEESDGDNEYTFLCNCSYFSSRNLKYMRKVAESYPDRRIVQQLVAQIPWGHNVRILDYKKTV
jgi:hypothetical protein